MRLCMVSIYFVAALAIAGCVSAEKVENHYHHPRPKYVDFEVEIDGKLVRQYRRVHHYEDEE